MALCLGHFQCFAVCATGTAAQWLSANTSEDVLGVQTKGLPATELRVCEGGAGRGSHGCRLDQKERPSCQQCHSVRA